MLGRPGTLDHLRKELLLLTTPKPKVKNPKKRIRELRAEITEGSSKLKDGYDRLQEIQAQINRIDEEERLASSPQILVVLGENQSGKTRLLRMFKDWLGDQARYYSETDELPDKPDKDYLLLDNPIHKEVVGQIENLAKGRKVILTLTDASRFKFSPKTRLNILKINGLDTVPDERVKVVR